jgi:hypothetical protein
MQLASRPRVLQMAWTTATSTPAADLLLRLRPRRVAARRAAALRQLFIFF